jgi:hypothetical protein
MRRLGIVAVGLVLVVAWGMVAAGCASSEEPPQATLTATPEPQVEPTTGPDGMDEEEGQKLLLQFFAEVLGPSVHGLVIEGSSASLGGVQYDLTDPKEAASLTSDIFFTNGDASLAQIDELGVEPFDVYPLCVAANAWVDSLARLDTESGESVKTLALILNAGDKLEALDAAVKAELESVDNPAKPSPQQRVDPARCEEEAKRIAEESARSSGNTSTDTAPTQVQVSVDAYLGLATLVFGELPEGYTPDTVLYDESSGKLSWAFGREDGMIGNMVFYLGSTSAAQEFAQDRVDLMTTDGTYRVEYNDSLDASVLTGNVGDSASAAVVFTRGRLYDDIVVFTEADQAVASELAQSLAATLIARIADLPLPGDTVMVEWPTWLVAEVGAMVSRGSNLEFALEEQDWDTAAQELEELTRSCEVNRLKEDYYDSWYPTAPACLRYFAAWSAAAEESYEEASDYVVDANRRLEEQFESMR